MEYAGIQTEFNNVQMLKDDSQRGVLCVNKSGEDIPPYAAMRLTGSISSDAREVSKPNADSMNSNEIVFNGALVIPANQVFFADTQFENYYYLKSGESPSIGDDIGTENGEWTLTTSQTGFKERGGSGRYRFCVPFSGAGVNRFREQDGINGLIFNAQQDTPPGQSFGVFPPGIYTKDTGWQDFDGYALRDDPLEVAYGGMQLCFYGGESDFTYAQPYMEFVGSGNIETEAPATADVTFYAKFRDSTTLTESTEYELGRFFGSRFRGFNSRINGITTRTGLEKFDQIKFSLILNVGETLYLAWFGDSGGRRIELYIPGHSLVGLAGGTWKD